MSIIQKANEITGTSTIVMGRHAEGKSTAVIDEIMGDAGNPLWVSFTNMGAFTPYARQLDWDTAQPTSWQEFQTDLYGALVSGEIDANKYDTIVIDGLNIAATLMLGVKGTITQQDYRQMGLTMQGIVARLRSMFDNIYVIIDIVDSAEGEEQLAINRDLFNQLVSLFGRKWYAYAEPTKEGSINYIVQANPTLAVRFKPVKK